MFACFIILLSNKIRVDIAVCVENSQRIRYKEGNIPSVVSCQSGSQLLLN